MLTTEKCTLCNGHKVAEQFQEKHGEAWVPERGSFDPPLPQWARAELYRNILAAWPHAFRWATVTCPKCDGRGEYEVEHFACKIF